TSFTVEYGLKGLYEKTVGRLTEWIAGNEMTDEDHYAALLAREYGTFVRKPPILRVFILAGASRALVGNEDSRTSSDSKVREKSLALRRLWNRGDLVRGNSIG